MAGRVWRLTRFELAKLFRQWFVYACFGVSVLLTWLGVYEWTPEELQGVWKRTGFDYLAQGISAAYLLLPTMLVVLGSRSVSGEASTGTLRTVMTRPVTRLDFILAKILSLVILSMALYSATLLAAEAFAWHRADRFRPLFQTYPVSGRWVANQTALRTLSELLVETLRNLPLLYLPLLCAALLGLLVSVLFNNEGVSVSVAAVVFLPYTMLAGLHQEFFKAIAPIRVAQWLPQYWAVAPMYKLKQFTEGYSEGFSWRAGELPHALLVPLGCAVLLSAASALVFRNRNILV